MEIVNEFEGANSEELNVLLTTFIECGKDFAKTDNKLRNDESIYSWLEKTSKKPLIEQIVSKLHTLGYKIDKIKSNE